MTIAIVKQNKQISDGIYLLTLYAPMVSGAAYPGQFINVYPPGDDLILPRPLSIAGTFDSEVSVIYAEVGEGTKRLTYLKVGDDVRILGPLGNGFNIDSISSIHDEVVCVGGGLGIPSMAYAARHCEERSDAAIRCTTIFGYRDNAWLPDEVLDSRLREKDNAIQISEHDKSVSGELGITGNVVDLLNIHEFTGANPIILSCGPIPMLKAVQEFAEARGIKTKLSLEARMGCGYGACVGCVISLKDKNEIAGQTRNDVRRKICTDGPVFDGDEIIW